MKRAVVLIAIAAVVVAVVLLARERVEAYVHDGIVGPGQASVVPPPQPARWQDHRGGSVSRLAVLLTDTDSAWLGLVHALESHGIPTRVTTDHREALRHRVVFVYPTISGKVLATEALQALAAFPRSGGTLIAGSVAGGGLEPVFGFEGVSSSRDRRAVLIDDTHPLAEGFVHPHERELGIDGLGSFGYLEPTRPPLARFDDGDAAIVYKDYDGGRALAFGLDLGFLCLKGYTWREVGISRQYVNGFDPGIDVFMRLIKGLYRAAQPAATLYPVPHGKPLAVMITHDVDSKLAMKTSLRFAGYEADQGVPATYLIQTKYVQDWNDEVFLDAAGAEIVARLEELGMEVGSHSVSHAVTFDAFELGSGRERYPDYRPFVESRDEARGGSILGELRVSKFLLEAFLERQPVVVFRPGHLSNPPQLPQALAATGYLFSSSVTANKSLTHLPFRLTYDREFSAPVPIYELPITIEDEHEPRMDLRVDAALDVARNIGRYGGTFVVLIHPDADYKLTFLEQLIPRLRELAWFDTLGGFGRWWAARSAVELDTEIDGDVLRATLQVPQPIDGLTLEIPEGAELLRTTPPDLGSVRQGSLLSFGQAQGEVVVELTLP